MEETIIKLSFKAPVHFGDGKLDSGAFSCDAATLFSALFIEALKMGCADELLDAARSGRMSLSDAFPYIGGDYYLPKPMLPTLALGDPPDAASSRGDSRAKKAFKKIQFIRAARYGDFLRGELDPLAELEAFRLGVSSLRTKVNLERRKSGDAEPYAVGGFSFFDNAGLYFLARGPYDLTPIVEQLQYSGLGGKRSSGYGRFSFEVVGGNPLQGEGFGARADSSDADKQLVLLSSSAPREDEITVDLLQGASYRLERKGGFVQSAAHAPTPQKKRDFYVFAAGSVFTRPYEGDIYDVNATPGAHPVYRYARAMWLEV